ncbi:HAD-IA family hydrolase [Labrys neptuniae]|uniref:HAD-IA family hydrolase n=1 Tax=Labrys neptuniae TaxID=376174 RepID=A0ABV3PXZ0_9HYPH
MTGTAFDLIICDCDGVLVDSEILASRIDAEELQRRGFDDYPLSEMLSRFAGVSQRDIIATVERESGRPIGADFAQTVAKRIEAVMHAELRALPDAARTLATMPQLKCVASSSAPSKLDLALRLSGLKPLFAPNIFSAVEVERGKPAPDLFLHAARRMGRLPERCCVIEDSVAGVTAAVAAGMTVIGFVGGAHCAPGHAERLTQIGAVAVVDHWKKLPEAMGAARVN